MARFRVLVVPDPERRTVASAAACGIGRVRAGRCSTRCACGSRSGGSSTASRRPSMPRERAGGADARGGPMGPAGGTASRAAEAGSEAIAAHGVCGRPALPRAAGRAGDHASRPVDRFRRGRGHRGRCRTRTRCSSARCSPTIRSRGRPTCSPRMCATSCARRGVHSTPRSPPPGTRSGSTARATTPIATWSSRFPRRSAAM